MSVQARFFVQSYTRHASSDHIQFTLVASGRGPENKTWAKWTPMGKMELSVTGGPAAEWFMDHLGKDLALIFEERPAICPKCHEECRTYGEHQDTFKCLSCEQVFNPNAPAE